MSKNFLEIFFLQAALAALANVIATDTSLTPQDKVVLEKFVADGAVAVTLL